MIQPSWLNALPVLKEYLTSPSPAKEEIILTTSSANSWFIPSFIELALNSIAECFLDPALVKDWISKYPISNTRKTIGIIMAGNIPLVGFHDLFCVLASGHRAKIKLSEKDAILLPFITDAWSELDASLADRIEYVHRLEKFDAVIATGSNNSARYFEYYFKSYPHLLRRNRNAVAVISGNETQDELKGLLQDVFQYFGLGCRNVSHVMVPEGYDFEGWQEMMHPWKFLEDHNSYRNNLDYNIAIYLINKVQHHSFGPLIVREDPAIGSRIGTLHYTFYHDMEEVQQKLATNKNEIQCVISGVDLEGWDFIPFGQSQYPGLDQYADGVDTMAFLTAL